MGLEIGPDTYVLGIDQHHIWYRNGGVWSPRARSQLSAGYRQKKLSIIKNYTTTARTAVGLKVDI